MELARTPKRAGGRPALGREGDVNERILDAATRLFIRQGYDGTNCDQVALDARAGKASIYARYANKAALLAAVIDQRLVRASVVVASAPPHGIRERLAAAAAAVLVAVLEEDTLALLRLLIGELPRLGEDGVDAAERWSQLAVRPLVLAIAGADPAPARLEEARALAQNCIDALVAPLLLRAMLGDDRALLLREGAMRIDHALVALAAQGQLAAWE